MAVSDWPWWLMPSSRIPRKSDARAMLSGRYRAVLLMYENRRIQTWALEEARRRLEKEGILEDPEK